MIQRLHPHEISLWRLGTGYHDTEKRTMNTERIDRDGTRGIPADGTPELKTEGQPR